MSARRAGSLLRTERDGRVLTVALDNPPRNFIGRELVGELDALLRRVGRDRSIGAVVLTGAHPASFITHFDVDEILAGTQRTPDAPRAVIDAWVRLTGLITRVPIGRRLLLASALRPFTRGVVTLHDTHRLYLRMSRIDKVLIAAINGHCAAGGLELALACDVRIAAEGDYMIGMTEPVLGFNPGGGGGQRLTRAVGPARAVEMLLEARMYSPEEALQVGLVHRVVQKDQLLSTAQETAARLARRSPRAIAGVKRAVYDGFSWRWRHGLHLDRAAFAWAAIAPQTERAMRHMLDQIAELPADEHPSPWSHPQLVREWQEGTAFDFN